MTPQQKYAEMEKRQKEALREEDAVLEATRAKTTRLRALRLEKEEREREEKAGQRGSKPARKSRAKS